MASEIRDWTLDERLRDDTHRLGRWKDVEIRLMDDCRWPWLILVPRQVAVDLDDLDDTARDDLFHLASQLSVILKSIGVASSTNVATLGNIVTQFHLHVVGRNSDDPGWPGPVWGFGERVRYEAAGREALIAKLSAAMSGALRPSDTE